MKWTFQLNTSFKLGYVPRTAAVAQNGTIGGTMPTAALKTSVESTEKKTYVLERMDFECLLSVEKLHQLNGKFINKL